MRKHDVRKWLHAVLDLLPVLIIPIFALAVRSDNNFQPISITTGEEVTRTYNFNQLVKNGLPTDDYDAPYWSYESEFGYASEDGVPDNYFSWGCEEYDEAWYESTAYAELGGECISGHQYLLKYDISLSISGSSNRGLVVGVRNENDSDANYINVYNNWVTHYDTFVFSSDRSYDWTNVYFLYEPDGEYYFQFYVRNLQLFDLTQMYGFGYEPSITTFKNRWTQSYYDYTLSSSITDVISDTTVTYNDTDVGSQMVYILYNATDKYFNFNSVGAFNNIYNWFSVNLFNGNVPLAFPIVYNIILYEFIMDIIFLTYAVFMFLIDFCEHLLDRAFTKSKGD